MASEAVFDKADVDGSGTIEASEFRDIAFELGYALTKEDVKKAMASIDRDGDGKITRSEFAQWTSYDSSGVRIETLWGITAKALEVRKQAYIIFTSIAGDGAKEITSDKLPALYKILKERGMTTVDEKSCIAALDHNKDGHVSFYEYTDWLETIHTLDSLDIRPKPPTTTKFTLDQLKAGVKGINPACKEEYLSDADFQTVFKKPRAEWNKQPAWKRVAEKKANGLH